MHRKVFQRFLHAAFRPGTSICPAPRHFHLMRNALLSKSSSLTPASEERTDFSDLSSEEFGTLRPLTRNIQEKMEELPEEEDERYEFDITNENGRKNRKPYKYYEDLIAKLLSEKKVVEALDVLETRILKTDRIKPWYRVYNLLISGCARVGYCDKSFALYHHMKEHGVKPTLATYTGLFNAVANSPFPQNALRKITKLRKLAADNGIELSTINYHAMIKAYARLKDTHAAFLVADEMLSKGHAVISETCNFLLQACISDTDAGLRHALLLWHKMKIRKIAPDLFSYNLFIRCIRDCGLGTEQDLRDVLEQINAGKREDAILLGSGKRSPWIKQISWKRKPKKTKQSSDADQMKSASNKTESGDDFIEVECERNEAILNDELEHNRVEIVDTSSKTESELMEPELVENRPNLLAASPHLGNIIALKDVKTPSDRLMLFGGLSTILEQMKSDEVKPDMKTFTMLLDTIPGTDAAEELLLKEIKNSDVHIDIDFCNMLIKKRAMRNDFEKAREVLELIQANYLQPDIVTFGVLATSCKNRLEAEELILQLRDFGYRMNMPILGAMLHQACRHFNFDYILFIMKRTMGWGILVSEEFLQTLDVFDSKMADIMKRKKRRDETLPQFFLRPSFAEDYKMWKDYYKRFRKEARLEVKTHPYKQFQKVEDDAEVAGKVENEAESTRRDNTRRTHNDRKEFRRNYKFGRQYNEQKEKSGVASSQSNLDPAGKENGFDSFEQRQAYRREKTQKNGWKRKAAKFEQKSNLMPQDDEELRDGRGDESSFKSYGEFIADEVQETGSGEWKTGNIGWKRKTAKFERKCRLMPPDDEGLSDAREDKSSPKSHGERNEFSADEEQGTDYGERKTKKISWKKKSAASE